jgi:hypothetical protein
MAAARDWTKPPPDAMFNLRVPVEYASIHAAVSGTSTPTLTFIFIDMIFSDLWPAIISMYKDCHSSASYQHALTQFNSLQVKTPTKLPFQESKEYASKL